jgi:hypothetical protein
MKTGFRLLFLISFLFSLSVAAFSDCLNNEPFGLVSFESKIIVGEEVVKADLRDVYLYERSTDVMSVEFIQSGTILLSVNNIEAGYGSQTREFNFVTESGLDATIRIRLPPVENISTLASRNVLNNIVR